MTVTDISKEEFDKVASGVDVEATKEFVERLFSVEQEIATLRDDQKALKAEFKEKLNTKLINNLIRLVKAEVMVTRTNTSPETIEELKEVILDKINKIV